MRYEKSLSAKRERKRKNGGVVIMQAVECKNN